MLLSGQGMYAGYKASPSCPFVGDISAAAVTTEVVRMICLASFMKWSMNLKGLNETFTRC